MFFRNIFGSRLSEPSYIRRTRGYLQEARMAMLEHSVAAEYYQASAQMYSERAARLEEELRQWEAMEQREQRLSGKALKDAKAEAGTAAAPAAVVRAAA